MEKSLSKLGSFAIFDLTKVGAAYQIINSFVDNEVVHAFEISPIGAAALLILNSKDQIALQFIFKQCQSIYQADILYSAYLKEIDATVIEAYLSQNKPEVKKHILMAEAQSFSEGFVLIQNLSQAGFQILDFRAVRTSPPNLIISATTNDVEVAQEFLKSYSQAKITFIENVQKPLKQYYEILN